MRFQDLILKLHEYWSGYGCVITEPYDTEVGAGTFYPTTFLKALGPEPWKTAYVAPSRRPQDGRYGENPYRFQYYFQYQVILKPSPADVHDLYLDSLRAIGIRVEDHDVRFVEDNWESPTLGAWGLGWEVWLDGMEITQFTYFQQVGGVDVNPVSVEITYGLERIALYLQNKKHTYDVEYAPGVTIVNLGGHFPGSCALHWADTADGLGALLTGDTIKPVMDRRYVGFMYSVVNYIPMGPTAVKEIVRRLEPFAFDRIYSLWSGHMVLSDGKEAVRRSAARHLEFIQQ